MKLRFRMKLWIWMKIKKENFSIFFLSISHCLAISLVSYHRTIPLFILSHVHVRMKIASHSFYLIFLPHLLFFLLFFFFFSETWYLFTGGFSFSLLAFFSCVSKHPKYLSISSLLLLLVLRHSTLACTWGKREIFVMLCHNYNESTFL